jgi:phage I-like protein
MGDNNTVIGLDSVGLVNRPNLLNKELNKKEKNNLDELEELKQKNKSLEDELAKLKGANQQTQTTPATQEQGNQTQELKDDMEVIKSALKEMNKKISLVAGKTNLEENDKKVTLSENDKKVADLLGLTHEEYLKSKEVK